MLKILFVTGAAGFIGQKLVASLHATGRWHIRALTRYPVAQPDNSAESRVIADLREVEAYRASLKGVDTVIHLAAVTGRATWNEYEQGNVEATKILLEACKEAGVGRFLYVSTVAAGYRDQRYYPYAQSKAKAEELVRKSGIPALIIRPTIVLGPGSPIWSMLTSIVKLPIVPLPNGGKVQLQPIHVDDLVAGIELALSVNRFQGETLVLGGPAPISFADLVRIVHRALYATEPRFVRVPLAPIRTFLALSEPLLHPVLPVTAGQLAIFANDSTVPSPNWLHDRLKRRLRSPDEIIASLVPKNRPESEATAEDLTALTRANLDRECDVFTRYLVSQRPTEYIRSQYAAAAIARHIADDAEFSSFDRRTIRLARRHVLLTQAADTYCAIFHRHGALRRKLILQLAILEHTAPTAARFDNPKTPVCLG